MIKGERLILMPLPLSYVRSGGGPAASQAPALSISSVLHK